jgi:uncharacterized DUF497 family protein
VRDLPLFRWDPAKAKSNLDKHGVSFEEASHALNDTFAVRRPDHYHSFAEDRFVVIGESVPGKILTVVFAIYEDHARIISARRAAPAERRHYMERDDVLRDAPMDEDMLPDYGHLDGWTRSEFRFILPEPIRLDQDVESFFRTSDEVNDALRMLIAEGRVPSAMRK